MKILIVAATWKEIAPIADYLGHTEFSIQIDNLISENLPQIDLLVTGLGVPATIYKLAQALQINSYNFIINAGIAGTYDNNIPIGSVVTVSRDSFADLGIEMANGFVSLSETGIDETDLISDRNTVFDCPYNNDLANSFSHLKKVIGATVNHAGNYLEQSKYNNQQPAASIETMESAAFFYVCFKKNVPFIALRAISNKVTHRDEAQWNIPLAVRNLNNELLLFIKSF